MKAREGCGEGDTRVWCEGRRKEGISWNLCTGLEDGGGKLGRFGIEFRGVGWRKESYLGRGLLGQTQDLGEGKQLGKWAFELLMGKEASIKKISQVELVELSGA